MSVEDSFKPGVTQTGPKGSIGASYNFGTQQAFRKKAL